MAKNSVEIWHEKNVNEEKVPNKIKNLKIKSSQAKKRIKQQFKLTKENNFFYLLI